MALGAGPAGALLLLAAAGPALAQAPAIMGLSPAANARATAGAGPLVVSSSQALTAGSGAALKVFGSQRGGLRTGSTPAVVVGNTLRFVPSPFPFGPGETVQYTVTAAATGSGPLAQPWVAQPWVAQLTGAVGGTGRGTFVPGSDPPAGPFPNTLALADVDGNGTLDLLTTNYGAGTVSVRLNHGLGT